MDIGCKFLQSCGKRFLAIGILFALSCLPAIADNIAFLGTTGTLSSNTPITASSLNGQSTCAVTFSGGGTFTTGFQISGDGLTGWNAAYTVDRTGNSVTTVISNGTYWSVVSSNKGFRINPGTVSGTVNYSFNCSTGSSIPRSSSLVLNSAISSVSGNVVVFGDSWVASGGPQTTCSGTFNVLNSSPSGNCFADLIAIHYGASLLNLGLAGTCVGEYGNSNYCHIQGNSGISRYVSQLIPNCIPGNLIIIEYAGVNEIYHTDAGLTAALFQSQLNTIVSACVANGIDPQNIILFDTPYIATASFPSQAQISFAVSGAAANVALLNHTRLAPIYENVVSCWVNAYPTPSSACSTDALHPNVLGNSLVASIVESATFATTMQALGFNLLASYIAQPASFGSLILNSPLAVAYGGTGSATQNFVDLTTSQSVAGQKTFTTGFTFPDNVTIPTTAGAANNLFLWGTPSQRSVFQFQRSDGGLSQISTNQAVTIPASGGVLSTLFSIGDAGVANLLSINKTSGDVGIFGNVVPAGIRFPGNPGGGTSATLNDYEVGTWTPTDHSAAGLTFTIYSANYIKTGKKVYIQIDMSYPVTANTNEAQINLPAGFTVIGANMALCMGYNNSGAAWDPNVAGLSGSYIVFYNNGTGASATNVNLSGARLVISGAYETTL